MSRGICSSLQGHVEIHSETRSPRPEKRSLKKKKKVEKTTSWLRVDDHAFVFVEMARAPLRDSAPPIETRRPDHLPSLEDSCVRKDKTTSLPLVLFRWRSGSSIRLRTFEFSQRLLFLTVVL